MKIIAHATPNSGSAYHRIITPLWLMPNADVILGNDMPDLKEEHFNGADIFMYNRILPEEVMVVLHRLREKYGFKICLDLDDHWELDPHHILYNDYLADDFATKQVEQIRSADLITVTNSRLAYEVARIRENSYHHVHVLPNAIPKQGQFDIEREPHYLTRLFWQGSDTHAADIRTIRGPIDSLGPLSKKIKMVMSGYHDESEPWQEMARDFTGHFKHQYKIMDYAPVTSYYAAYAHADICLIPLLKSRFNGYKSNLKVLEAANLGLPCIVSHVDPYLDLPVIYAKKGQDWAKEIKRLVDSKKRRKEAGHELKEFCDLHFNFNKINAKRRQIFDHYSKKG